MEYIIKILCTLGYTVCAGIFYTVHVCSYVAIRFSKSYVFSGGANTWTWDELAAQFVEPPYRPHLVST